MRLKKRGMDVAELYFPDEGHGFAKEENRLLYYKELAKFFDRHLKKPGTLRQPGQRPVARSKSIILTFWPTKSEWKRHPSAAILFRCSSTSFA